MGGTWTSQNKVLPGVYMNFKSNKPLAITPGDRGVVSLPLELDWGVKGKIYEVDKVTDTLVNLGYSRQKIQAINEALKGAIKVLVYRVNGGVKATANVVEGVTATAICKGVRGNNLSVKVVKNREAHDIITLLDGVEMDKQTVTDFAQFKANDWITLSGTGILAPALVTLASGSNTPANLADYQKYLDAMKTQFFNTIGYIGSDSEVKSAIVDFVTYQREEEGVKVQAVLAKGTALDYEGIITVGNGVVLDDGTIISKEQACAWVAGVTAGSPINKSNTNKKYIGAIDVNPRMTKTQKEAAILNGEFIFSVNSSQEVTALYDINSLTSETVDKSKDFKKNRIIRILDNINNDITTVFETNYLGKSDNNAAGRSLFRASIIEYMRQLEKMSAIENFTPDDVQVNPGVDKDAVVVDIYVQPVDSAEKFYMTVNVR